MDRKHLASTLELKQVEDNGKFTGYASVFNVVDGQRDIVERGAFNKTIQGRAGEIKMLWQHLAMQPIGTWETLREDDKGLYVEGNLLMEVQQAREAYALLKSGAVNGLSIGYGIKDYEIDRKQGVRKLKDLHLSEISLVTFPANESATIEQVKALEGVSPEDAWQHKIEIEAALRDAGASRSFAKFLISHIEPPAQRDAEGEQLTNTLNNALNILKG